MFDFFPVLGECSQCFTVKCGGSYRFFRDDLCQLLVSRLHRMSREVFLSSLFSEIIHVNWYYFFLKCFMELTGKAIWAQNFFCGKGFD